MSIDLPTTQVARQTAAAATPAAMNPFNCRFSMHRAGVHLADTGEEVADQPDSRLGQIARPSRADSDGRTRTLESLIKITSCLRCRSIAARLSTLGFSPNAGQPTTSRAS